MNIGSRLSVRVERWPKSGYGGSGYARIPSLGSTQYRVSLTVRPRQKKSPLVKVTSSDNCGICGRNTVCYSEASRSMLSGLHSVLGICEGCGGKLLTKEWRANRG